MKRLIKRKGKIRPRKRKLKWKSFKQIKVEKTSYRPVTRTKEWINERKKEKREKDRDRKKSIDNVLCALIQAIPNWRICPFLTSGLFLFPYRTDWNLGLKRTRSQCPPRSSPEWPLSQVRPSPISPPYTGVTNCFSLARLQHRNDLNKSALQSRLP